MTHSYRIHFFHLIWSTKQRKPFISDDVLSRLQPYIGAVIKDRTGHLLEFGGQPDHVHLLVELSSLDNFSHTIRDIKTSTSLWIHRTFPELKAFAWQEGYGSFSVSYSGLESVRQYILNQDQHHAKMSFEEEYKKFLKLHDVNFDERFVLG